MQAAIFDFDGTLFDSMFIWDTAGRDYLISQGVQPREDLMEHISTTSLYQAAAYMQEAYSLPLSVKDIMDGINRTVEGYYFYTVQPRKGLEPFLRQLQKQGVKLCIATATDRYQIEAALNRCGLADYFSEIFTCSAVGHGKDEPHIFEAALSHLGTQREKTYVFEDAIYAARTACKAGFPVVQVYDDHEKEQAAFRELAAFYMENLEDTREFFRFFFE